MDKKTAKDQIWRLKEIMLMISDKKATVQKKLDDLTSILGVASSALDDRISYCEGNMTGEEFEARLESMQDLLGEENILFGIVKHII